MGAFSRSGFSGKGKKFTLKNKKIPAKKPVEKKVGEYSRYYDADDTKTPIHRRFKCAPTKLRASITPGTVLIILSGRFRGVRCVFLKQLDSGLLLVTGPYKVNGCPLRRVNQRYVIATSSELPVTAKSFADITDADFAAETTTDAEGNKERVVPAKLKTAQDAVDAGMMKTLKSGKGLSTMGKYMKTRFTLQKGQYPHDMKF